MVWGPAWASVRGLEGVPREDSVAIAGPERLSAWPGPEEGPLPAGAVLALVTADPQAAGEYAASLGLRPTGVLALLTAQTGNLDLAPSLPENANVAEAPMEDYDAVEVALFDHPVADGRIKLAEGLAVVGGLTVDAAHQDQAGVFEQAMVAVLAEEAFLHGADTLYLVADAAQAGRFAAVEGWTKVADILSFAR